MNLKTIYNKITKDIHAVSPVVATLVLIVVAIIGAAAVGVITGTFADQVGDQRTDPATAGRTLIISGSTSAYPIVKEIAKGFMLANPGIRVITQSVGTGTGVRAVGLDTIDIGMASRDITPAEFTAYPALVGRVVTIGNATVLLVGNAGSITLADLHNLTHHDLHALFNNGTRPERVGVTNITRGVFRSDSSGTGDRFLSDIVRGVPAVTPAISHTSVHAAAAAHPANLSLAHGNAGVRDTIRDTTGAIGGIDMGFLVTGVRASTEPRLRLIRPLHLITNGAPSALEQAFIDYARTPGAIRYFTAQGAHSIATP